ncbi:hypothetical protein JHK86_009641 [Glycine max]|nr:hypothetical protein JHK86_009641 [Glycine max]
MGMTKPHVLMLLIIMVVSIAEKPSVIEGRALSLISGQGNCRVLKDFCNAWCCDGVGGACTSKWTESCNNLQCFPWKSHCTKQHQIFYAN